MSMMELIYHSIVRSIRKQHGNAFMALAMNILQTVLFVMAFYVMFSILGMRGAALRGDFLLYIMSGIFLYLTHIKAMGAVSGSEGPASPMMQHAPMTTIVAISSAALGALYIQVLSAAVVLFIYHVAFVPITIDQPVETFAMMLLAWFTGCSLGLVLLAVKPWFPTFVSIFSQIYQRANMIAMFDWNPLFHCIDQARGYVFLNYNPRYSDWEYAMWVGIIFLMIGLMGEFYTRKHASVSWNARR